MVNWKVIILVLSLSVLFQSKEIETTIFTDDFSSDLALWKVEQMPGGTVQINDGWLEIDDKDGCTVWFRQKLQDDIKISYDVVLVSQNGPNDRVSDLNCFWMASDSNHTNNLFFDGNNRTGKFADYHNLQLYYVGYGANNNTTTRFRRYPGDGSRPMLPEHDLSAPEFMNIANMVRHIEITSKQGEQIFRVDGKTVYQIHDDKPFLQGWFGFRTVNNHMKIDNFKIVQIKNN